MLFAVATTTVSAFAADPNGTWKFSTTMPNGRTTESTLALVWQQNQLTGTIDNRAGKASIEKASFANDQIDFTVQREFGRRLRKKKFTVHYTGNVEGDTITGTIQTSGRDEKPISVPWKAERVK
ncbi:hypothetical protein Oter_2303 [Opitutus terrae PB90-1]|uniref:Lipocalin-like domain-containing protein n=2 Tax=Opitutus terrae TaxID=107709 RepID=B1ZQH6_OPITP|nr:hypothetical protein Oter_2303 [Opitutus terrae PB90-1]